MLAGSSGCVTDRPGRRLAYIEATGGDGSEDLTRLVEKRSWAGPWADFAPSQVSTAALV